jgi:hypothetical protein
VAAHAEREWCGRAGRNGYHGLGGGVRAGWDGRGLLVGAQEQHSQQGRERGEAHLVAAHVPRHGRKVHVGPCIRRRQRMRRARHGKECVDRKPGAAPVSDAERLDGDDGSLPSPAAAHAPPPPHSAECRRPSQASGQALPR